MTGGASLTWTGCARAVARETASAGDDSESAENGVAPADESAS